MTLSSQHPLEQPLDALTRVVGDTVARREDWWHRVQLPVDQDRWWTRLASLGDADVCLLTWLPGHSTDLHDHGRSAASFAVVQGELAEVRADQDGTLTRHRWHPSSVTWLAPGVVHEVTGAGTRPAVSVHAYAPRLTEMTYYDTDTRAGLRAVRTVRTAEPEQLTV